MQCSLLPLIMFRIYRGLGPPYGLALTHTFPPYVHYPPLTPFSPLPFSQYAGLPGFPHLTLESGACLFSHLGALRSLFYLLTFCWTFRILKSWVTKWYIRLVIDGS